MGGKVSRENDSDHDAVAVVDDAAHVVDDAGVDDEVVEFENPIEEGAGGSGWDDGTEAAADAEFTTINDVNDEGEPTRRPSETALEVPEETSIGDLGSVSVLDVEKKEKMLATRSKILTLEPMHTPPVVALLMCCRALQTVGWQIGNSTYHLIYILSPPPPQTLTQRLLHVHAALASARGICRAGLPDGIP